MSFTFIFPYILHAIIPHFLSTFFFFLILLPLNFILSLIQFFPLFCKCYHHSTIICVLQFDSFLSSLIDYAQSCHFVLFILFFLLQMFVKASNNMLRKDLIRTISFFFIVFGWVSRLILKQSLFKYCRWNQKWPVHAMSTPLMLLSSGLVINLNCFKKFKKRVNSI